MKYKLLVIFAIYSINTFCQKADSLLLNSFFSNMQSDKIDLRILYNSNKWFDQKQEDIEKIELKLKETIGNIGKMISYERIKDKRIVDSYYIVWYLVKFDRQPLCFKFSFYKPNDKWQMQSFKYELSLDELW